MSHLLMRFPLFILYVITFITGASGLIYEVTWQKYLSRLLGSDNIATAIILATFLGGLSFGYYFYGTISTRVKNHLKAYAIVEGLIGLWCMFFPNIFSTIELLTRHWSFSPPVFIVLQGFFSSVLIIGVPTICMGGTIPLLTRGISRNLTEATRIHARVYAINTAGAFLGTLIAGFYLIPNYGLPVTVMGTSSLNLGAFLIIFFLSGNIEPKSEFKLKGEANVPNAIGAIFQQSKYSAGSLLIIALLSGFYVMTLENVLIRITNFSLGSSSYSFSLIVAVFIFSIAIGSFIVGKLNQIPRYYLFINQLLIALLLLLIYLTLDTWPYYAHIIRITFQSNTIGFWGYYTLVFLVLTLALILPISLIGATVPLIFHELKRDLKLVGKYSGTILSLNTIGNLAGSLVGGIGFFYFLNNAGVFLSACTLASLSAAIAAWHLSKRYFYPVLVLSVLILGFTFKTPFYNYNHFTLGTFRMRAPVAFTWLGPTDFFPKFNENNKLVYYDDGPAATVAVLEVPDVLGGKILTSRAIIVNGKSDSSAISDARTLKLLAHLPALLMSKKENVMVIGLGTGVTAGELSLYPEVKNIDVAEISATVIKALPYFREYTYNIEKNPRLRIHEGDAFRILTRSQQRWNIIISEPSNPWTTGVDLLFTREFYKKVNERLTDEGIFVQWLQVYAASDSMVGMIVNTLQQEFRYARAFVAEKGDLILLASNKKISEENIKSAEKTLYANKKVKDSLEKINIRTVESILVREIWPFSYVADNFSRYGTQTMDNPRLHYMAGKSFFINNTLPNEFLFNSTSVKYLNDYLMLLKHKDWKNLPISDQLADGFIAAFTQNNFKDYNTLIASLKLKAYLSNPEKYPLSPIEKAALKIELLPFIGGFSQEEKDWANILPEAPVFREKAQAILGHVGQFRNWIVPYPLDGLEQLLYKGIFKGKDVYERNWCVLSLVLVLYGENAADRVLEEVIKYSVKGNDGRILVKDQDVKLLHSIERLLNKKALL